MSSEIVIVVVCFDRSKCWDLATI